MTSFLTRLVHRGPRADHLRLTIYTRRQCCCCRNAIELIEPYRRRHRFQVEFIDVDTDPALAAEHGQHVPVIAVNGKVRFRGIVNSVLFERLLDHEARNKPDDRP